MYLQGKLGEAHAVDGAPVGLRAWAGAAFRCHTAGPHPK